jgi:hypothetical protein
MNTSVFDMFTMVFCSLSLIEALSCDDGQCSAALADESNFVQTKKVKDGCLEHSCDDNVENTSFIQRDFTLVQTMTTALESDVKALSTAVGKDGSSNAEANSGSETSEVDIKKVIEKIDQMGGELKQIALNITGGSPHQPQTAPAQESFVRNWFACAIMDLQKQSAMDRQSGVKMGSSLLCTKQYVFEELCCLDFEKLTFVNRVDVFFEELPPQAHGNTKENALTAGLLCTSKVNGTGRNMQAPIECANRVYPMTELKDATVVLSARIVWLMEQGLGPQAIPTCKKTFKDRGDDYCGDGTDLKGQPPNSASNAQLEALYSKPSLLQQPNNNNLSYAAPDSMWTTLLQVDRAEESAKRVESFYRTARLSARRGAFLSTSGSFTLSAGGNGRGGDA